MLTMMICENLSGVGGNLSLVVATTTSSPKSLCSQLSLKQSLVFINTKMLSFNHVQLSGEFVNKKSYLKTFDFYLLL